MDMNWRDYQSRQRCLHLGHRLLSYVDLGVGEPVVLLHGAPTWGYVWHSIVAPLAAGRRVLVPDLPGYGWSDRSDRFDRTLPRQTQAILELLDCLELDRVTLVGHDLGGAVALRLAALVPDRIRGLVLIASACYDAARLPALDDLTHADRPREFPPAACERRLRSVFRRGTATRISAPVLQGLLAPWRTDVGRVSLARDVAAIEPGGTLELTPWLPRLAVRTLVVWGERDPLRSIALGERLAFDMPRARLIRIPNARHFVMLDRPEALLAQLLEFINTEDASRAPDRRIPLTARH
jgi:pimeloyl-ACP methyl ester carboxylesterase